MKDKSSNKILYIFIICLAIYLFSYVSLLSINDYYFRDDNLRLASGYTYFEGLSRYLSHYMLNSFSLSSVAYDYSPLPQLLCLIFIALSGIVLLRTFAVKETYFSALTICILGLFPFFWEIVLYTYDSIFMGLSIFLSCIPFLFIKRKAVFCLVSIISLLGVLTTYQSSIGCYPIIALFLILDYFFVNNNKKIAIQVLVQSVISFLSALVIFKLFIYHPYDGHVKTDEIQISLVENFTKSIEQILEYIPHSSGLFWLLTIILCVYISGFVFFSKKNKFITILVAIASLIIALIMSLLLNIIYGLPGVYRYYISFVFLITVISICGYKFWIVKNNKLVISLNSLWIVTIVHLGFMTSALGNTVMTQWNYDKYRLTMAIQDLIPLISDRSDFLVAFSRLESQNTVVNVRNRAKIYQHPSFSSNLNAYGNQQIIARYILNKRGNPQCYGQEKVVVNNLFHTIYVQGDCYKVQFNELQKEPDYSHVKPDFSNVCYSDDNWNISYRKGYLIYSLSKKLALEINKEEDNRFFLHLFKKDMQGKLNKDFPAQFIFEDDRAWTVRSIDIEEFNDINTGIFNDQGRLYDFKFSLEKCKLAN